MTNDGELFLAIKKESNFEWTQSPQVRIYIIFKNFLAVQKLANWQFLSLINIAIC